MSRKKKAPLKPTASPRTRKIPLNPARTWGLGAAPPACVKLVTVTINSTGFVNHRQAVKRGYCVRWHDKTGQSRTLIFVNWPFTESWQSIDVPANGFSNTYHVAQGVASKDYPYVPTPQAASGPPDPPAVVVGD